MLIYKQTIGSVTPLWTLISLVGRSVIISYEDRQVGKLHFHAPLVEFVLYRPGNEVQFRVIVLSPQLKPTVTGRDKNNFIKNDYNF